MAAARARRSRRLHAAREPRSERSHRPSPRPSISSSSTPHRHRYDSEDSEDHEGRASETQLRLSAASSRASSLRSDDLNPPGRTVYTFRHTTNSDKRAIRRARYKSNPQIIWHRQITHTDSTRPAFVFGVKAQYEVILSPAHTFNCSCVDRPSRATICEHIWAVQEALLEHSGRAGDVSQSTWRFDCQPTAKIGNLDSGASELVYELFERDRSHISRRLRLADFDGYHGDRLRDATKQLLCAISPSALLPSELFDDGTPDDLTEYVLLFCLEARRLTNRSLVFQRICYVLLNEAQSDPRIHLTLQSIASQDDIQSMLVRRLRSRLDAIFSPLDARQYSHGPSAHEPDLGALALKLQQLAHAIRTYDRTFSGASMISPSCRQELVELLLNAIERVIETEASPHAHGSGASLFERLIATPPGFALDALHGLSDVFAENQELRLRASLSVRALLRMRTPIEYISALKAIARLA
ncbi:hypothetical protein K461DRAFT_264396 [Myriangium duriaei CBS 260.36]|uniref:SWIM-type domain-containing protein n=1 Tax=Myriangium duriaei CBS 260.36 TaxID=1168546 RepID=A0A9P4JER0_9PEZI|nr:hypothetical protein K461DRAFT_264396 [Myriangium duriaei CBS 260.36]